MFISNPDETSNFTFKNLLLKGFCAAYNSKLVTSLPNIDISTYKIPTALEISD